jgi:hypothetical protein
VSGAPKRTIIKIIIFIAQIIIFFILIPWIIIKIIIFCTQIIIFLIWILWVIIKIIIFITQIIIYFEMNTLNYKKNNNIYNTNNYINKPKTQEPWVLTKDPIDLGPDAKPKWNGF